jgi:hypothetical protein
MLGAMAFRILKLLAASSALVVLAAAPPQPTSALHFPAITADTLSKQTLHLPADFGPADSLVVLAFERDQQKDLDTWDKPAADLAAKHAGFSFYEMPVLPWRDVFYRWWLNTAMRSGLPDDAARKRTVPVYVNKEKFKSSLQITTEQTITVVLLDKSGGVLWRSSGPWTEEKGRALAFALDHS